MITPTTGTLRILVASRDAVYSCAPGIAAEVTSVRGPSADLPDGKAWLTVTSPAGWLHVDFAADGSCALAMGDAPAAPDTSGTPEQMFDHVSNLMGGEPVG